MNLGWFGVPPSGGSNGLGRLKPGLQAVRGFMVPMHGHKTVKALLKTLSGKALCPARFQRARDSNVFAESTLLPVCDEPDQLVIKEYGHRLAIMRPTQMHRLPGRWLQSRANSSAIQGYDCRLAAHTVELWWCGHSIVEPTICGRLPCILVREVKPRHATVVLDNSPSPGDWVLLRDE